MNVPVAADPPIVVDWPLDVAITAVGGGAWIASEAFKPTLAPAACRWCVPDAIDRRIQQSWVWSSTGTADALSSVIGFVAAPASAFGLSGVGTFSSGSRNGSKDALSTFAADALVIGESAVLAADVNQAVKLAVGRRRPFAWAASLRGESVTDPDANLSFFSGHTTLAFALAASAGTTAWLRRSPATPAVWVVGILLGSGAGYLRIAADKHYATDVLVGAAVGSAIGVVVPLLHVPRMPGRIAVRPATSGALLVWSGSW